MERVIAGKYFITSNISMLVGWEVVW